MWNIINYYFVKKYCQKKFWKHEYLPMYRIFFYRKYKERERLKDEASDKEFTELEDYIHRLENVIDAQNQVGTYL